MNRSYMIIGFVMLIIIGGIFATNSKLFDYMEETESDIDESFGKIEEITVEDLYSHISEDGEEQEELSRTADVYMYYHKTLECVVAIDVYNTGYLDVSVQYNKQKSPLEHIFDLSEKNFEEYKDLRWSELEESKLEELIRKFRRFESDYLQGKIILEESEK